jgi:hypothetical protein
MADEDDGAVRNGGRGAGGHLDDGDDDDEDEDAAGDSETPFSGRPPEFGGEPKLAPSCVNRR